MNAGVVILLIVAGVILLPSLTYMVVKFGAAGYFRAKRRDKQNQKTNNQNE